jgi:tRNA1(Val) A37 N6-methylase TrmN6
MAAVTVGGLLGNRCIYKQLQEGHRSGFEPVLLAACVRAKAGDAVLEAGTGAGAALLCLGTRVPGLRGVGVERDAALMALAIENFKINGLNEFSAVSADAAALPFSSQSFDHVLANPPWFGAADTASPDAKRDLAHRAAPALLGNWINELGRVVKPKGSISLIIPAASFAAAVAALRGQKCGAISLIPLWPRAGQAAKMAVVTAVKASRAGSKILPGLVLHDGQGITPAAQAVLRDGAALYGE